MNHQFYFLPCVAHDINLGYHRSVDLRWTLSGSDLIHHATFISSHMHYIVDIYNGLTQQETQPQCVTPFLHEATKIAMWIHGPFPYKITCKEFGRKINKTFCRKILWRLETVLLVVIVSLTYDRQLGSSVISMPTLRWYTTIGSPSYFFITLNCTEAIQNFISHFNQYSLVDPFWGNNPSCVWERVSHWFKKLWHRVWHHHHFGNWIHENNYIFITHPNKHTRSWKTISTINVTYAPMRINWARHIACDFFIQQQPASSFSTVSNVMVLLCELRYQ